MKNLKLKRIDFLGWSLNIPYLLYTAVFFLIPLVWALWLSAMEWNLISADKTFVFLDNFVKAVADKKIIKAFSNSFRYLFYIVTLTSIFSLAIGLIVSQLSEKVKGIVAVLFFIPYLTSGVSTSVVVRYLFSYNSILNEFLRNEFNMDINWFKDPRYAFAIIIGLIVWKMSGYYGLFILSALENIPTDVHEAAMLDGSFGFNKFFKITLPLIIPSMSSVVVLASGLAFGIFTEPFLLTGGGPNLATTTWQLEIYNISFVKFDSGYGAAVAILNAINIFVVLKIIQAISDSVYRKYG